MNFTRLVVPRNVSLLILCKGNSAQKEEQELVGGWNGNDLRLSFCCSALIISPGQNCRTKALSPADSPPYLPLCSTCCILALSSSLPQSYSLSPFPSLPHSTSLSGSFHPTVHHFIPLLSFFPSHSCASSLLSLSVPLCLTSSRIPFVCQTTFDRLIRKHRNHTINISNPLLSCVIGLIAVKPLLKPWQPGRRMQPVSAASPTLPILTPSTCVHVITRVNTHTMSALMATTDLLTQCLDENISCRLRLDQCR